GKGYQFGTFAPDIFIGCIVEESVGFEKILVPNGVIRMTVALHAFHGGSLENAPGGINPVNNSGDPELFIFSSAFVIGHGVAMESRRDIILICWIGKEVVGELLGHKYVK